MYRRSRSPPSPSPLLPSVTHTHIRLIHHQASLKASHTYSTIDLHGPNGPRVHPPATASDTRRDKNGLHCARSGKKQKAPACAARAVGIESRRHDGLAPQTRRVMTCEVRRKHEGSTARRKRDRTGGSARVCARVWVFRVQHVVHGWCTHVRTSGDVLTRPKQKAHLYVARLRSSSLIGR